jgi:hypothetical protein
VASRSGKVNRGRSPTSNGPYRASEQREKVDEDLFSENGENQYRALKAIANADDITVEQYDRLQDIRYSTSRQDTAELAGKILRKQAEPSTIARIVLREVFALVLRDRPRNHRLLFATSRESLTINPAGASFMRQLVFTALASFVLGSMFTYVVIPRRERSSMETGTAYIDTRTGQLVSMDSESSRDRARQENSGNYQPAFYCWKCRQWLPVKNPKSHGTSVTGPLQAVADRPTSPRQK